MTPWISENFGYLAAGLIVLIGLLVGLPDLLRLSPRRIWAIGSVGFRESLRRRVLWVTPLAMLGVVAVTQLSHPVDEQDAIRQATKYCLFASGLVVVIATLILACTSLPKEIDNRVIYTIVTKPATRLEIVLGKLTAFAATSAVILLIMGAFSYAYLRADAVQLDASVQGRLKAMPAGDPGRETLAQYANEGLLNARTLVQLEAPAWGRRPDVQVYSRVPRPADPFRWVFGNEEQHVLLPFRLPQHVFDHPDAVVELAVRLKAEQPRPLNRRELEFDRRDPEATTRPSTRPNAPGGVDTFPSRPKATINVLGPDAYTVGGSNQMIDPEHPLDPAKSKPGDFRNTNQIPLEMRDGLFQVRALIPPNVVQFIRNNVQPDPDGDRHLYVMVAGTSLATQYGYAPDALRVTAYDPAGQAIVADPKRLTADAQGNPLPAWFRGRLSVIGQQTQQLRGDENADEAPVAVYSFHDAPPLDADAQSAAFEFRTRIERSGADQSEAENVTRVDVTVANRKDGFVSPPVTITPDSDRAATVRVPRRAVDGGDFEVRVQCRTPGHFVGLRPTSVSLIASTQTFAGNLSKALLILWALSLLVVSVSIFCSTFVSWPIAIVLALVMLLGRWCVTQLGEQSSPAQIATEIFGNSGSAVGARVLTDTVGALSWVLGGISKVLPDLDSFRVTADIERGATISARTLLIDPMKVLLGYGVPVLLLAYLFLRKKEVAP